MVGNKECRDFLQMGMEDTVIKGEEEIEDIESFLRSEIEEIMSTNAVDGTAWYNHY